MQNLTPGLAYAEQLLYGSKKTEIAQRIIKQARTTIELKAAYFTDEPDDLNDPAQIAFEEKTLRGICAGLLGMCVIAAVILEVVS